jgi:RNA polymerase sigma-70 factor (sigma-E family)
VSYRLILYEGVSVDAEPTAEGAFAEFVAGCYVGLVRTGYLLTGDRGYAEDLVQQCLLTTYHSWERLYGLGNAEAYTRTSMVRLAIKWRRRRWRGEVPTDPMPEAYIGDHAGGVALAEQVRRALARLPAAQRAVLVLRFFDDRSESETAAMLRCSVGTVKSRASRALNALRAQGLLLDEEPIVVHGLSDTAGDRPELEKQR